MTATATAIPAGDAAVASPTLEAVRDITRGGFAGILIGIFVCGVGGRLVMRVAALLVPGADGFFTENGFRIGNITIGGTLSLLGVGLAIGLIAGTIWVIVSPWIPGKGVRRAVLTIPVALALGGRGLIDAGNADFRILEFSAVVVAMLVGLIAIVGSSFALVDDRLERLMPRPVSRRNATAWLYAGVAFLGTVLILPLTMSAFILSNEPWVVLQGIALVITGLVTLTWWIHRRDGTVAPTPVQARVGRAGVLVMVVVGLVALAPEIAASLGLGRS